MYGSHVSRAAWQFGRNSGGQWRSGRSLISARLKGSIETAALLSPMVGFLLIAAIWPFLHTIILSFSTATGGWAGFSNYLSFRGTWHGLLADRTWWKAVWLALEFTAASVGIEMVLGLLVALLLNVDLPGRAFLRCIVLVPWAVPTVAAAQTWRWVLNDQFGVLNQILLGLGLIDNPVAWLANPSTAFWAIVAVDSWKTTPFVALILLSGLQAVPEELQHAARMDGAGPIARLWHITLPLLLPIMVVAAAFRTIEALAVFDVIYVLTANSPDTLVMASYAQRQLVAFQQRGVGSAAAVVVVLITAAIVVTYLVTQRRQGRANA